MIISLHIFLHVLTNLDHARSPFFLSIYFLGIHYGPFYVHTSSNQYLSLPPLRYLVLHAITSAINLLQWE